MLHQPGRRPLGPLSLSMSGPRPLIRKRCGLCCVLAVTVAESSVPSEPQAPGRPGPFIRSLLPPFVGESRRGVRCHQDISAAFQGSPSPLCAVPPRSEAVPQALPFSEPCPWHPLPGNSLAACCSSSSCFSLPGIQPCSLLLPFGFLPHGQVFPNGGGTTVKSPSSQLSCVAGWLGSLGELGWCCLLEDVELSWGCAGQVCEGL